jgi:hypothetical protein
VQRPGGHRIEAVYDAVPDEGVREPVAPGRGIDRQEPAVPGRGQRIRNALVVPPGLVSRCAVAVGYGTRQELLVDGLAEDGGRFGDDALGRREGGQQAGDDHGEIRRLGSGPDRGDEQRQAAGALMHVGRHRWIDKLRDLFGGEGCEDKTPAGPLISRMPPAG